MGGTHTGHHVQCKLPHPTHLPSHSYVTVFSNPTMSQTFDVSVSANVSANVTHAGSTLSGFESASFPMDGRIAQVSPGFGILYVLVLVAALEL